MSSETNSLKARPQSRWVQDSTLGAGAILILLLFVMVNYLAIRHYQRFDWTANKIYTLSQKSRNIVEGITEEIELILYIDPRSPIYGPVNELLNSYAAASPNLTKREIDLAKNMIEAQRLAQRYSIERENVVIIASGDDRRVIDEIELAELDYSGMQMNQPPTISEFKGEQQITSALLALIEARKPKVLFTTGHGEAALDRRDARSLSQTKSLLGGDNFEIEEWGALGKEEVPADTDLVVIAGPTTNFLPPELEMLGSYLDTGGRLLLMLDPVFDEGTGGLVELGFTDWLAGYGVEIRKDLVIDPASQLPFFEPEAIFTDSFGAHPVVEALEKRRTRVLLPLARSVSPASTVPDGIEVTELIRTSPEGWGETDLDLDEEIGLGENDLAGPVPLAVAVSFEGGSSEASETAPVDETAEGEPTEEAPEVEDETGDEAESEAEEARLLVFGDLDFASDAWIGSYDNAVLLLNAFNWLVKREEMIDIEARKPEQTSLTLSQGQLAQVYLMVLIIMPGLAVAFGIWIYMRRKR